MTVESTRPRNRLTALVSSVALSGMLLALLPAVGSSAPAMAAPAARTSVTANSVTSAARLVAESTMRTAAGANCGARTVPIGYQTLSQELASHGADVPADSVAYATETVFNGYTEKDPTYFRDAAAVRSSKFRGLEVSDNPTGIDFAIGTPIGFPGCPRAAHAEASPNVHAITAANGQFSPWAATYLSFTAAVITRITVTAALLYFPATARFAIAGGEIVGGFVGGFVYNGLTRGKWDIKTVLAGMTSSLISAVGGAAVRTLYPGTEDAISATAGGVLDRAGAALTWSRTSAAQVATEMNQLAHAVPL